MNTIYNKWTANTISVNRSVFYLPPPSRPFAAHRSRRVDSSNRIHAQSPGRKANQDPRTSAVHPTFGIFVASVVFAIAHVADSPAVEVVFERLSRRPSYLGTESRSTAGQIYIINTIFPL